MKTYNQIKNFYTHQQQNYKKIYKKFYKNTKVSLAELQEFLTENHNNEQD